MIRLSTSFSNELWIISIMLITHNYSKSALKAIIISLRLFAEAIFNISYSVKFTMSSQIVIFNQINGKIQIVLCASYSIADLHFYDMICIVILGNVLDSLYMIIKNRNCLLYA